MKFFDWPFRRNKDKSPKKKEVAKKKRGKLEKICGNDKEAYKALRNIILLDPKKLLGSKKPKVFIEETELRAKELERNDLSGAYNCYREGGQIAIFIGDIKRVKKYFSKCAELKPDTELKILEIPERAVEKAQKYYDKYLI